MWSLSQLEISLLAEYQKKIVKNQQRDTKAEQAGWLFLENAYSE